MKTPKAKMTADQKAMRRSWIVLFSLLGIVVLVLVGVVGRQIYKNHKAEEHAKEYQLQRQWIVLGFEGEPLYDENGKFDLAGLDTGEVWIRVQVYNQEMDPNITMEELLDSVMGKEGSDPKIIKRFTKFYNDEAGGPGVRDNGAIYREYYRQIKNAHESESFVKDHPDLADIPFENLTPEQLEILEQYIV